MWRSKKFILATVLGAVLLAGSIGGIALAQTENGDSDQPTTLFDRVTAILVDKGVDITSEQLKDAFTQAQSQMRTEALQNRLKGLVDQDKITQGEADQYLEWWQLRPDVPVGFGLRGHGGFRGMGGMRGMPGFYGPRAPTG